MSFRFLSRVSAMTALVALFVISAGCGPNYKARAIVKGKVSISGKPLTAGTIQFHGKDNITGAATITKQGTYEMKDAPLGDVVVTVFVPKLPPGGIAAMKGSAALKKDKESVDPSGSGKTISIMGDMPENVVPIPDKYGNTSTSDLKYKVEKGEHTWDINLKP